jgi:hypothetical protein
MRLRKSRFFSMELKKYCSLNQGDTGVICFFCLKVLTHMSSHPIFWWVRVAHLLSFLCCVFTFWVRCCSVCPLRFLHENDVRFVFVSSILSYLRYLCLFAYSGVPHILCCVFVLFVFVLCILCYRFLWIVHFWLPLPYSLKFLNFTKFQI